MAGKDTLLKQFVASEVSKVKGIAVPVRAGVLERGMVRRVSCKKLHPNPNDEFCFPEIGPSEEIVNKYVRYYSTYRMDPDENHFEGRNGEDPLFVQKIRPHGYMILNGHHRWAAAVRVGKNSLPVRIINLTQEKDVRMALEHSRHDRRVTMDLEEVVYATKDHDQMEKPLHFPRNLIYRERLHLGIPALFSFFSTRGYDIWLYSAGYESMDYVMELLKGYHTRVTGIITGTARKNPRDGKSWETMEQLMKQKYEQTIHIDVHQMICIDNRTGGFREFPLAEGPGWAAQIMEAMGEVLKDG